MRPPSAFDACLAHLTAASWSSASITQKPPTYCGASKNGPSTTTGSPLVASTVLADDGGGSPPAKRNTPDSWRSVLNSCTAASAASSSAGSIDSMVGSSAESWGTVKKNCITRRSFWRVVRTRLAVPSALDPQQPALHVVQPLEAVGGDRDELSRLHAGVLVAGHDVRLHHERHPRLERELGDRLERPARTPEHRREVAADEAVHGIVARRVDGVLYHAGSRDKVGG